MKINVGGTFHGASGSFGWWTFYQKNGKTIMRLNGRFMDRQRTRESADENKNRCDFAAVAYAWTHTVPDGVKAQWKRLAVRVPRWNEDGSPKAGPMTGHMCFVMVNRGRQSLKLPLLLDCPSAADLPPFLGDVTVTIQEAPPAPQFWGEETTERGSVPRGPARQGQNTNNAVELLPPRIGGLGGPLSSPLQGLVLLVTPDAAFACPVQIWATNGLLPSASAPPAKRFSQLCVLPNGLPAGGVDVGELFADAGLVCWPGEKVAVRVVPLSRTGFKGQAVTAFGLMPEGV